MSKHTPGPWEWELYYDEYVELKAGKEPIIASNIDFVYVSNSADARLIAAAPEMLELLKKIHKASFLWVTMFRVPMEYEDEASVLIGLHAALAALAAVGEGR